MVEFGNGIQGSITFADKTDIGRATNMLDKMGELMKNRMWVYEKVVEQYE